MPSGWPLGRCSEGGQKLFRAAKVQVGRIEQGADLRLGGPGRGLGFGATGLELVDVDADTGVLHVDHHRQEVQFQLQHLVESRGGHLGTEYPGQAFEVWREPFTELRVPLLFNLRRDPYEKAQHNSDTYNDLFLGRVFILAPMQRVAGQFLMTMKEYPPSQSRDSFNLEGIQKKIQATICGR